MEKHTVGTKIDHPSIGEFVCAPFGVARWFLPKLLVWINFDSMDNFIESIRILRAGYRDDLRD